MMQLTYPDGSVHEFPSRTTGIEVASSIGRSLGKAALAVSIDGAEYDLGRPLPDAGGTFAVITADSDAGRTIIRHSSAHVLAQAVLELFPGSTFGIGPPITDGFYYDFQVDEAFTPEDVERIEARMQEIIAEDQPFIREEMTREAALELFADHAFKVELIKTVDPTQMDAEGDLVSAYRNTDVFIDLCRGPHVPSTKRIKAMKLTRTSGAYWRGDEENPQLQRVYGTAWESKTAMADYLHRLEEAIRRDHRKLGPELDLFSFPSELGSGLAVWHPKGGLMRKIMEDHSRKLHEEFGFEFVISPHLAKADLWETSGHLGYYAENMYPGMEMEGGQEYRVKPMNCPLHVMIYRSKTRSYRDLPVRLSELGAVYRNERSGVLHGLLRIRGFTQDDSHTFCRRDQLADELAMHLEFVLRWLRDFGFTEFEADLSTQPEKWVGDQALWDLSTEALRQSLVDAGVPFEVAEGEGAFYGPKIDVHVTDAIGRRWQVSTIQVDMSLPERFGIEYDSSENTRERPVMIHAAKAGSFERFFGVLLEHYAGAFPMWLTPVQATVVTVADRHTEYAESVASQMREHGLRVEVDASSGKLGEKVRKAITTKSGSLLVVGDNDVDTLTAGFRLRGEDEERGVPVSKIIDTLEVAARKPGE